MICWEIGAVLIEDPYILYFFFFFFPVTVSTIDDVFVDMYGEEPAGGVYVPIILSGVRLNFIPRHIYCKLKRNSAIP